MRQWSIHVTICQRQAQKAGACNVSTPNCGCLGQKVKTKRDTEMRTTGNEKREKKKIKYGGVIGQGSCVRGLRLHLCIFASRRWSSILCPVLASRVCSVSLLHLDTDIGLPVSCLLPLSLRMTHLTGRACLYEDAASDSVDLSNASLLPSMHCVVSLQACVLL